MFREILSLLRDKWDQILPDTKMPERLTPVLKSKTRIVLFLFDSESRDTSPLAVVKVCRTPQYNALVARSISRIETFRGYLDAELLKTIPNTVLLGQVYGLNCTAETVVPGELMKVPGRKFRSERIREDIEAVANWLAAFHKQTTIDQWFLDQDQLDSLVIDCLAPFLHLHENSREAHHFLDAAADRLLGKPILRTWRYGDTNPSNFLLQDGRVSGVFDFPDCGPHRWPIFDWFLFAFCYATDHCSAVSGRKHRTLADSLDALDILLTPPNNNPVAELLQNATQRFMVSQNLGQEMFPWLFGVFLTEMDYKWDVKALLRHAWPHLVNRAGLYCATILIEVSLLLSL